MQFDIKRARQLARALARHPAGGHGPCARACLQLIAHLEQLDNQWTADVEALNKRIAELETDLKAARDGDEDWKTIWKARGKGKSN
jgi:hypothetical protein